MPLFHSYHCVVCRCRAKHIFPWNLFSLTETAVACRSRERTNDNFVANRVGHFPLESPANVDDKAFRSLCVLMGILCNFEWMQPENKNALKRAEVVHCIIQLQSAVQRTHTHSTHSWAILTFSMDTFCVNPNAMNSEWPMTLNCALMLPLTPLCG